MKNLVLISCPGVKEILKYFSQENEKNPDVVAGYFGKLMDKYFSYGGFYDLEVDNFKIKLEKVEKDKIGARNYIQMEIIAPKSISDLENFVKGGFSLIKGTFKGNYFEGRINKNLDGDSIEITKGEKSLSFS